LIRNIEERLRFLQDHYGFEGYLLGISSKGKRKLLRTGGLEGLVGGMEERIFTYWVIGRLIGEIWTFNFLSTRGLT